jgi:hypothetical protein
MLTPMGVAGGFCCHSLHRSKISKICERCRLGAPALRLFKVVSLILLVMAPPGEMLLSPFEGASLAMPASAVRTGVAGTGVATTGIAGTGVASNAPPGALTQPALDRQIERVLENPEFNWREPYSPAHRSKQKSLLDQFTSSIRETLLSIGHALDRLRKWLLQIFDFKRVFAQPVTSGTPFSSGLFNALAYLLWAALAGTLILFIVRLQRLRATPRPRPAIPPPVPSLADDEIAPDKLPDDEWSALAGQKLAAGEFRQALRALFLAILALLATRRFIIVERWKSNSDYEKELRRKAKNRADLLALFVQSRLGFERCWYGRESVTLEAVESYRGIYERIKHAAISNL